MSLRRNDSSTAFLSHWLTLPVAVGLRSATRALPLSSRSSAASTASRTAPLVFGPILSRALEGVVDDFGELVVRHGGPGARLRAVCRGPGGDVKQRERRLI